MFAADNRRTKYGFKQDNVKVEPWFGADSHLEAGRSVASGAMAAKRPWTEPKCRLANQCLGYLFAGILITGYAVSAAGYFAHKLEPMHSGPPEMGSPKPRYVIYADAPLVAAHSGGSQGMRMPDNISEGNSAMNIAYSLARHGPPFSRRERRS